MRYLSLFSGIEAASVAWHPLGWQAVAFAEIENFPCAVLAHHYPNTPNLGDVTRFKDWPDATVDVLVGGSPCQAFSVAGLRKGLDDPRGNLTLTYLAVVERYRPRWMVWENVPGVLSIDAGRTFAVFLGGLAELGYGVAFRILDAQYFGVPQRRRRVFVVGHLGDWRRAASVLFERHCLSWNPPPSRKAGKNVAGTLKSCARSCGWSNSADHAAAGYMQVCPTLRAGGNSTGGDRPPGTDVDTVESLIVTGTLSARTDGGGLGTDFECSGGIIAFHGSQDPDASENITHPLGRNRGTETCIAIHERIARDNQGELNGIGISQETAFTLDTRGTQQSVATGVCVRRLTPRECERLMGFPDDYTAIGYRGRPAADGPRYKALGNSFAVPVMRWIGERIAAVEQIKEAE